MKDRALPRGSAGPKSQSHPESSPRSGPGRGSPKGSAPPAAEVCPDGCQRQRSQGVRGAWGCAAGATHRESALCLLLCAAGGGRRRPSSNSSSCCCCRLPPALCRRPGERIPPHRGQKASLPRDCGGKGRRAGPKPSRTTRAQAAPQSRAGHAPSLGPPKMHPAVGPSPQGKAKCPLASFRQRKLGKMHTEKACKKISVNPSQVLVEQCWQLRLREFWLERKRFLPCWKQSNSRVPYLFINFLSLPSQSYL